MTVVDDVANRLEAVHLERNVGDKDLAIKKKKNENLRGKPVQIATNMRKINLVENKPIYKYAAQVLFVFKKSDETEITVEKSKSIGKGPEHERDKNICGAAYKKAVGQCPELQKGGPFYYDRQASLYSFTRIKNDCLSVKLTGTDVSKDPDFVRAEFKLTKVADSFQTTSNDVAKSVNACPAKADKTILEAMNMIVSGGPLQNPDILTIGNCVHYLYVDEVSNMKVVTGAGFKESAVGTSKSIKTLEGKGTPTLYMTTELKTTLFHPDNKSLYDVLKNHPGFNDRMDANSSWAMNVKESIIGLSCYLNYGRCKGMGNERIIVKIKGFGASARNQNFERNGKNISVLQYFKDQYDINLRCPDLFTITARGRDRRDQNIPVEVLELCPSQPVRTEQMSKKEQAELIKLSAAKPHIREKVTNDVASSIGLGSDTQNYVKVSAPEVVTGHVLPLPVIKTGGNPINWNDPKKKGFATDFDVNRFSKPAKLIKWAVVFDTSCPHEEAVSSLVKTMRDMGMQVENPQVKFIVNRDLKPIFADGVKNKLQLLLFITKSFNNYHKEMKCLEQEHDLLTQDIQFETAEKLVYQGNTRKNIANKINIKLGGMNYEVDSKCFRDRQLIIGFETSQKGGDGDAPISVGFSANMSEHNMQFTGGYVFVKRTSDVYGPIIKSVVMKCVREWEEHHKKDGEIPQVASVVLYFSGITEGQYGLANETYLSQVKDAFLAMGSNKPHLTIIAASKLHNTRLYKKDQRGVSNLEPGTVVDETIVNPRYTEWYSSSAVARQGTNKAAKYCIVFTTDGSALEYYERLTYDLCFEHQIVCHPVSYPAPLYVAGSFSARGATILSKRRAIYTNGEFDFQATNESLGVLGKKLSKTRFNA